MRTHTIHTAVRFSMMMAAALGVTLAAADARAEGDVDLGGGTSAPNSSIGSAALKYEHGKGLETTIQTGWMGPSIVQANVGIKIDPVTAGGPRVVVGKPQGADVEGGWGAGKKTNLKGRTGGACGGR